MACIGDALVINTILDHLDEQVAPEPLRLLPQRGQRLPARPRADCAASDNDPSGAVWRAQGSRLCGTPGGRC
jgi:hypothetical protein